METERILNAIEHFLSSVRGISQIPQALDNNFCVSDPGGPANATDALFEISDALHRIANALEDRS
jgi:hypothetical protein